MANASRLRPKVWVGWLGDESTESTGYCRPLGVFKTNTLQEINISHLPKRKIIFKMPFLGDMMLVPGRVPGVFLNENHRFSCVLNWIVGIVTCFFSKKIYLKILHVLHCSELMLMYHGSFWPKNREFLNHMVDLQHTSEKAAFSFYVMWCLCWWHVVPISGVMRPYWIWVFGPILQEPNKSWAPMSAV